MSTVPIFLATHPRSCSTAFERVFMTRSDLRCIHEPFGDAFYYGPERLSSRFADAERVRSESGFAESTYKTIVDKIEKNGAEGGRLFVKDMAYYIMSPENTPTCIAPSLATKKRGIGTLVSSSGVEPSATNDIHYASHSVSISAPNNPTTLPGNFFDNYHVTFLIRHPRSSIPSYYRCTIPPLNDMTGFYDFMPSEAGYSELRQFFEYVRSKGRHDDDGAKKASLCVVDADDLLNNPAGIVRAFCDRVQLDFEPSMLDWSTEADHKQAADAFAKWKGFHEDAINSDGLKPRNKSKKTLAKQEEDAQWTEKFGASGAKVIRATVDANIEHYEYLKQFALKPYPE